MAVPSKRPRRDAYGARLPELSDASRESFLERDVNVEQRKFVKDVLDKYFRDHLRRGEYVTINLTVQITDGMIQQDIKVNTERNWRKT